MVPQPEHGPCTPARVRAADGARLVRCAHGGQVLGWTPAGAGDRDRLWVSPLARCGAGEAIRGGIPVIFPQFAGRGPLPKHGLARDRPWELDIGPDGAKVARTSAVLRDDARTRALWPHRFTLTLVTEAAGRDLTLALAVRNDAPPDGSPFTMTLALHAYFAVRADRAEVTGLAGLDAEDNATGGTLVRMPDGPLPAGGPMDLAVRGGRGPVTVGDGLGGRLEIAGEGDDGFDSLVVWNPGPGHGLADVPSGGADQFLCVEPARLSPVRVEPQGSWRASVRLTALVP